jgi:nucleoside-diphosphate-sugar epimerase
VILIDETSKGGSLVRLCITGCAGFLGYWVAAQCLDAGIEVDGVDDLSSTYHASLKEWRPASVTTWRRSDRCAIGRSGLMEAKSRPLAAPEKFLDRTYEEAASRA